MRTMIMGCGRVGSALAQQLCRESWDVCVVDSDPGSRELLTASYPGMFLVGNGFHRAILETGGVAHADAFVAVTSGDNTNIVGARIAKDYYRVPNVIARIYDPRRADIYHDLGITTVASVRWTVDRIHQMLQHRDLRPDASFGNGETLLVREVLPPWLADRPARELEVDGQIRVIAITRRGRSFLPEPQTTVMKGDSVSFAVASAALGRLRSFLDRDLGS